MHAQTDAEGSKSDLSRVLTGAGAPQTMSSREIAELTAKEHDNVRRDIRNMASTLSLTFEEKVEASTGGRPSKVFLLPKRETLILVSGYSVHLRARIIDRWEELERGAAAMPAINVRDDAQMAEIALQLQAYCAELRARVAVLEPKAEAFDNLANPSLGNWTPTDTARALGVTRDRLIVDLIAMNWVFRKPGRDGKGLLVGYAAAESRGLVAHRQNHWTDRHAVEHASLQVEITPLGRQRLTLHYTSRPGTLLERPSPTALPAPASLIQ